MVNRKHAPFGWRHGVRVALVALLLQSCERIDPVRNGDSPGGDSVVLTCEGCHTTRAYLRRLAIDDGSGGGGGGG